MQQASRRCCSSEQPLQSELNAVKSVGTSVEAARSGAGPRYRLRAAGLAHFRAEPSPGSEEICVSKVTEAASS